MKRKGYKRSEIAKELNLLPRQVENICTRYRMNFDDNTLFPAKTTVEQEEEKFLAPPDSAPVVVDNEIIGTIKPMAKPKESLNIQINTKELKEKLNQTFKEVKTSMEEKREKTLNDFSARDIIKNMYERGYRLEGNLYCLIKKPVDVAGIIGE